MIHNFLKMELVWILILQMLKFLFFFFSVSLQYTNVHDEMEGPQPHINQSVAMAIAGSSLYSTRENDYDILPGVNILCCANILHQIVYIHHLILPDAVIYPDHLRGLCFWSGALRQPSLISHRGQAKPNRVAYESFPSSFRGLCI